MRRAFAVTALLSAGLALAACGGKEGSAPAASSAGAPAAPAPTEADLAAAQARLPAPFNTADLANGERKWLLCKSCHTLVEGGATLTGPPLHGMFGRPVAGLADYRYSAPLQAHGGMWNAATLDSWIADPRAMVPGTKMSFAGVKAPQDRTDLIAYLMLQTGSEAP